MVIYQTYTVPKPVIEFIFRTIHYVQCDSEGAMSLKKELCRTSISNGGFGELNRMVYNVLSS
jgi:hypothetical protein